MRGQPVEIVNLRLVVTAKRPRAAAGAREARARRRCKQALLEKREGVVSRSRVRRDAGLRPRPAAGRTAASPARRSSSRWTRRPWCRRARGCATTGSAICTWRSSRCPTQGVVKEQPRRSGPQPGGRSDQAEVVARFLLATAEEMGATLMRTAFSPNIKERADCSTAIFDRAGAGDRARAARADPSRLDGRRGGRDPQALSARARSVPGDMFIANDPYNGGGTHLPDINVIAPVFIGQAHRRVRRQHRAPRRRRRHGAGLRSGGVPVDLPGRHTHPAGAHHAARARSTATCFDIILLNSRTPDERVGDLQAQFAANTVGMRSVLRSSSATARARPRRRSPPTSISPRSAFARRSSRLPAGRYEAEDYLDGNDEGERREDQARAHGRQGPARFRFRGLGPAARLRAQHSVSRAARDRLHRREERCSIPEVPANAGYYRTLDVSAPPGSVVGPVPPAAIGCRSISASVLGDVIAAALSQALPDKALAGSGPHHLYVLVRHRSAHRRATSSTTRRSPAAWARARTATASTACACTRRARPTCRSKRSSTPIPFRVERYALWDDSAGAGRIAAAWASCATTACSPTTSS